MYHPVTRDAFINIKAYPSAPEVDVIGQELGAKVDPGEGEAGDAHQDDVQELVLAEVTENRNVDI